MPQPTPHETLAKGVLLDGRYRIEKVIGSGGYASVYKALDLNYNVERAVKEVTDPDKGVREQFRLEADLLMNISSPNIPRGYSVFEVGKRIYFVMDFVSGKDLEELLNESLTQQRRPLDEAQTLRWAIEICSALSVIHGLRMPVIHRDIKPANIKITPDNHPILIDFGLAKVQQQDAQKATRAAAQGVSPGFAPPEQYMAKGRTDARTDVYGLGATIYACLTGRDPAEAPARLLDQTGVSHGSSLVSPRSLNPRVSPRTEEVIIKALELSPSRRQQSAAELEADLRNALDILLANGAGGSTVTMAHGAVPRSSGAPLNQNSAKGRAVKAPAPKAPAPMPTPHNPRIAANIPPAGGRPAAQVARGAAMNAAAMNGARQITALNPPLNSPSAGAGTAVSQDSGQLRTLAAAVPPSAAARASSKHAAVSAPQPALGMNTAEHAVLQLRGGNAQAAALATNGAIAVAEKERSNKLPRVSAKGAAVAAAAAPAIDRRSWIHFGSTLVTTFGKWLLAFSVIEALWGAVSILLGIIGIANHGLSMATLQRLGLVWLVVVVLLSLYGGQALSRPVYRKGALGGVRRGMQGLALFAYTVIVHLVAIWGATVFISSPGNSALAVIAYTIFGVNVLVAGVLSVYNILD